MKGPRIMLALLLALGTTLVVSAGASAEPSTTITVTKMVTDSYVMPGGTIHYRYEVTANDRFTGSTIVVTDNKCSPVTPTLGGGPGGAYNIGDTADYGFLNGFLGEKWIFTCNATAPVVNPATDLTNTATVVGNIAYDGYTQFSDTDSFTLEAVVLRKHVVLYWDYVHEIVAPGTGDVTFPVDLYKNSVKVGTENVSANTPLALWLTPGSWNLTEGTPPTGYSALRGNWNLTVPDGYADNTFFNQATFDLAIEKSGPLLAHKGDNITYTYDVTNTGPGLVTPAVTDNTCSPVTYASGDDGDNLIEPGETWHFTCTTTTPPSWDAAFPFVGLTNTATVADANKPSGAPWNLAQLMGGETNLANNTDTFTLDPYIIRKDVIELGTGHQLNDSTPFTVTIKQGQTIVGTVQIKEGYPAALWLVPGMYTFCETVLPFYIPNFECWTQTVGTDYPDWTIVNAKWYGFSHGYYKNQGHRIGWQSLSPPVGAAYIESKTLEDVFGVPNGFGLANVTLYEALSFKGGPDPSGKAQILLKQAVAALLNESRFGASFGDFTLPELITNVNTALAGSESDMTSLASVLDYWNNGLVV
jgi:hypothetical protein